ncbi:general odorant-binding protein 19d-like [Calliphora vicina]|uniref:general odorant-binding protein 19d-like n=1 Tax=Calliphora vicina TaxID=7373 RepID=UPI00325BAF3B
MKIFVIIFLVLSVEETLQQSLDGLMELAKTSVIDCYEDEENTKKIEITETGFEDIANGSRDAVRNAKCIRYCIMKKHNLFSDDNSLNEAEIVPFFAYLFNNTIDKNHLKGIIADCNKAIARETDRCERSYMANNCILQRLNESGMKGI